MNFYLKELQDIKERTVDTLKLCRMQLSAGTEETQEIHSGESSAERRQRHAGAFELDIKDVKLS